SWLDTLNMAGVAAALLISLGLMRGGRGAASHAGRVWTVIVYLLSALLLSPGFLRGGNSSFSVPSTLEVLNGPALVIFIQALSAVLIWALTARPVSSPIGELFPDTEAPPPGQRLEEF